MLRTLWIMTMTLTLPMTSTSTSVSPATHALTCLSTVTDYAGTCDSRARYWYDSRPTNLDTLPATYALACISTLA
ncbi:hypothetical protein BGX38DRAFT_1154106 [Terfezia claveryi]|nr:hypothetical protein BGX38DRAFT_1154106 [Terfezia claveryi]